ncbi:MAG: M67 family metallopeptidase [Candidatus Caldarchaeum sp.]|nr:M67 family metallopeptidase [Candidatus Caldarchaeum sp.]MDW8063360.1 M67 family metallopeptidase [Candidatus Caldarchaeum sp.]
MKLLVRRKIFEEILQRCVDGYPYETAGLMLGFMAPAEVIEIVSVRNVHEGDRRVRYLVDPIEYYNAEKTAEAKGLEVVGVYHSHPDHPARPSAYDLEYALPPWYYLIVSVTAGKAVEYKCWRAVEKNGVKSFQEQNFEVVE